jgi:hypothetical protein
MHVGSQLSGLHFFLTYRKWQGELSDEIMALYIPSAAPGDFSLLVDPGIFHPLTFI